MRKPTHRRSVIYGWTNSSNIVDAVVFFDVIMILSRRSRCGCLTLAAGERAQFKTRCPGRSSCGLGIMSKLAPDVVKNSALSARVEVPQNSIYGR